MLELMPGIPEGKIISPENVVKSPWEYYGEPLIFSGYVEAAVDHPPGSSWAQVGVLSQIVITADDGTIVEFWSANSSGDLKYDDYSTITGYPIGRTEVENALGGKDTHLIVVTNNLN
jgi:hypothetical protein